jgi:hypothetical protein
MGTGSTLALLPPENATGNFVKVVQRLPVRIDLVDYSADQTPLFIGTSVVPYVYGELLDVADEPGHQSGAGRLAASGADRRACDVLHPCKRGGFSVCRPRCEGRRSAC